MTAVLALAACKMEDITPSVQTGNDENMVLDFSIVVPEAQTATKSFAAPEISSLTVIVFDEYGYLVQAVPATAVNGWGVTSAETKFKVTLLQSASPRTLHFVANCPVAPDAFEYGAETDIMSSLITTGTDDAYWQTLSFDNLLEQSKPSIITAMTKIPMIRNFAKITLGNVVNTFEVTGFALIKVPESGTVVPYNEETGGFQAYSASTDYAALKTAKYAGFMPDGVEINDAVPATAWIEPVTKDDGTIDYGAAYTYESTYGNGTAVIIRGKYDGGNETYYKVDLYDAVNENYDILRNIEYKINITNVVGPGYGSAESAATNVAGNNISNSIDTENLLNISDGKQRLFVEYTSKRVVSIADFTLKYKFIPTATADPKNAIADGDPTDEAPIKITRVVTSENADKTPVIIDWDVVTDANGNMVLDSEGYATLRLKPQQQMPATRSEVWSEDFIISSTYKGVTLSRKVKLYMVNPYEMDVVCSPQKVSATQGAPVTVYTRIPHDLPVDIFPLVFDIEAEKLTLYPNTEAQNVLGQTIVMPVITDESVNPDNSDYSFYFQRTLTLAEYEKLVENAAGATTVDVPSYFLTNTSHSASKVFVRNTYFGTEVSYFDDDAPLQMNVTFSGDGLNRYGAGQTFVLTFSATKTGKYVITSKNFTIDGVSANVEFDMTDGIPVNVNCSYDDWSTAASITIEYKGADVSGGTNPQTWTGPDRNVLYIPAGNLQLSSSMNRTPTLYANGSSTGSTITYSNSTLNSAASITVNNLAQDAKLYMRYTARAGWSTTTYKSTEFTAQAAAFDKVTGITFTEQ